ncbi:hypothetical protein E4631_21090 [Hymenobacter sp. UV11]|uniref:DUF6799 domain-containing protein n=1 Tax=Hymenobacter sp. UV11 TaxID=1849735 RepID=UPI00105E450E|nr:DUF6799 domain-containing protein [Hymenobacter sp. UV11]TDN38802.1 hypothetical protein A8B98_21785 [Hymenobacter sp. UV11]TFZ63793.1 hypothetical protein E4631_21090 [Hymenobacter sp. UV11]
MKKITHFLPLLLLTAIGSPAYAQTTPKPAHAAKKAPADYCMMKNGKMTMMKNGKAMPMMASMTMSDGTKCLPDGTCQSKDGTTHKMKEGECMMMNGKMTMHPDSTRHPGMMKMGNMRM